jgi:hypothetical protein
MPGGRPLYIEDQYGPVALPVIATRILAVLAATLLVAAFTIATVFPPDMPLAAGVAMLDHSALSRWQDLASVHLPPWVWPNVVVPLLVRPAWLLPACFGVVIAGAATSLASTATASRSRRRRS